MLFRIIYYAFLLFSSLAILYFIAIDLQEIADRMQGKYTLMSAFNTFSDRFAIAYCLVCTLIFFAILCAIVYFCRKQKPKMAILSAFLSWLLFFLSLIFEKYNTYSYL